MSRFLRFLGVFVAAIACVFGAVAPRAGYADDPVTYPFTVDVHISDGNSPFVFTINAAGTFYVNWGDGSAEQQVVAGVVSSRVSQHTYDTAGYYTVGLRGTATGYSDDSEVPAISFGDSGNNTDDAVVGISGSLGAIFPTIDNQKIPSFYGTFDGCQNLTGAIPADLFSGVTGTRSKMFSQTFSGTRITSIPAGLFNGIVGDAQEAMFYGTFYNCTGLREIPDGLFSGVVGRAKNAFAYTFGECANIGGYIPKHLFNLGGLVYGASDTMMYYTFKNTDLADTCSDFRLTHYPTDFDTDWDGPVVCAPMATFTCDMPNVGGTGTAPTSIWLDEITNQTEMPDTAVCTAPTHYSDNHKWACTGVINCDGGSWAVGTAVPSWLRTQTANVDFYNNYAPDVYSVTLNANNGNGGVAALYEQYNVGWAETNASGTVFGELTVSSLPTRSNYTFIGYYTAQSGGTRVIDAAGHVLALPDTLAAGGTTWYAHWESSSGPFTVTFKCDEDGTVVNTQTIGYQGVLNVPDASSSVCSKQGYSFSNWKIVANGELIPISSNNGTFTWSKYFSSDVVPNWGNTQTTITLNPHNTANASGTSGQRYIYTTAGVGAYLDSARTKLMKTNDNKIELPTKSVRLIFDLNDTVMVPATLTSGTCNSDTGTTLSGTVFEESLAFDGYFSAPNGGTQYIGDGGFLTSGAESVVESYVNNMTWHAQWKPTNPIENCKISEFSPTRPGYIFNGWWTQAVGGIRKDQNCSGDNLPGCFDFINHPWVIDSDTVLYAQWEPVCNAITLDSNNNAATAGTILTLYKKTGTPGTWYTDNNCTIVFTSGDYADVIPMRSGWVFRGFYLNLTDAFDVSATQSSGAARYITNTGVPTETGNTWNPTGNATLYAGWARDCVSAAAASCSLNVSGDAVGYTTSCNTGYTLDSGGGTYNPICTANTYNITYNYNGGTVGSSALPAGYTRVEYIESDGAQYIDTNVLGLNKRIVIDAQYTGTATAVKVLAGYSASYNGTMISSYNRKWGVGSSNSTQTSVASTNRTLISAVLDADSNGYNRATLTANGETVAYTRTESGGIRADAGLRLFGATGTNSYRFIGRIYGVTIYDNNTGTVLFNGIPARNSSDVLGLYDTVRGTFFENTGSGSFTAGNAVTVPYPATYTYGTGAMVYGMPAAPLNNVFVGWCRDAALTTGCEMPHEITAAEYGDKTLYAKYDCVYGYSRNAQTGQCEIDAPFTVTIKVPANAATEFKFHIAAKGTFVIDWGDGSPARVVTRTAVSTIAYSHTYAAVAGAGVEDTQTFDIKIAGLATEYSGDSSSGAIRFYNGTPDSNGGLGTGAVDGTEVYIDHISGSLGAIFPTVGAGDSDNTVPHFYRTFMNAKNMTQTMSSLVNLFDGVNGTSVYMFNSTFYNCKKLTGSIPADLFGRVKNGVYSGIDGAPTSYMFQRTFRDCSGLTGSIPENLFGRVVNGVYHGIDGAPASMLFSLTFTGCSGLTGSIPENLFGRVVNGAFHGVDGTPTSQNFYYTFSGCSGLTGSIPGNLFSRKVNGVCYGVKGQPAANMFDHTFSECSGLTGPIPEDLFGCIVGTPASSLFRFTFSNCSGLTTAQGATTAIPENLFAGISGAPASNMFYATFYGCSGLTGPIPGNLFGRVVNNEFVGISGAPKTYMFASTFLNCTGLTGSIPATLFGRTVNGTYYGISGTPASYMFYKTFEGDRYLTGEIPSYLFGHLSGDAKEGMFNRTFYNCRGLTGTIPGNLFGGTDLTGPGVANMFVQAFYNCTNLSGYVPENLFGGTVYPTTDQGNMVQSVFYNTGLATSCPCGTIDVTTNSPWYTYWSSRVSCRVGLDTGQHWYNGQCTTMCSNASIDELHVGSLSAFPVLADKVATPSINVKLGNTQCYVPLATGNGGTNSFNISYDGNVYHADRPDDITPVGFGQRD